MMPANPTEERWNRVRAHQKADPELNSLWKFLSGDLESLSQQDARAVAKIADQFVLDGEGVLRYAAGSSKSRTRGDSLRLVVPSAMKADILHLHHDDLQGGHQGITRTFERIKTSTTGEVCLGTWKITYENVLIA